jgi:hypothetical protein
MRCIILVVAILLSIIVAGCDEPPVKKPPNLNPDSNVTTGINIEWERIHGDSGVRVINSSARIHEYQFNVQEIVVFNTTDGNSHYAHIFFNNTKGSPEFYSNESPNMLDMNGWPAVYYNITIT